MVGSGRVSQPGGRRVHSRSSVGSAAPGGPGRTSRPASEFRARYASPRRTAEEERHLGVDVGVGSGRRDDGGRSSPCGRAAPVRGSIRWWRTCPPCDQRRKSDARGGEAGVAEHAPGRDPLLAGGDRRRNRPAVQARRGCRGRQIPACIHQARPDCPQQVGNAVGGPALGDAGQIEPNAGRQLTRASGVHLDGAPGFAACRGGDTGRGNLAPGHLHRVPPMACPETDGTELAADDVSAWKSRS